MPARTALDEMAKDGAFKRKDAAWRNWISRDADARFPPEKDRYHLYVAYAWYVDMCRDSSASIQPAFSSDRTSTIFLPARGHTEL